MPAYAPPAFNHINFAVAEVLVAPVPANTGTALVVSAGVQLPAAPFLASVCPGGEPSTQTNAEVIEVTAVGVGNALTIRREAEGPTGLRTIKPGDQFIVCLTAGMLRAMSPPPVGITGTIYVSPQGNDANPGTVWTLPKKTMEAAQEALPSTGEKRINGQLVRTGRLELGAATGTEACPAFVVESTFVREGLATFPGGGQFVKVPERVKLKKLKGKPYVQVNLTGAGMLKGSAADIGRVLVNPEMPSKSMEAAEILDYWEGELDGNGIRLDKAGTGKTYFTLSKAVSKNVTELLYLGAPVAKFGPGVSVNGRGQMAAQSGIGRRGLHAGTLIEDVGNFLTFYIESGTPQKPVEGRNTFSNFALHAKVRPRKREEGFGEYRADIAIWGFYVQDTFGTTFEKLSVYGYTGWGAYIGNNAGAEFLASLCNFTECGNVASKIGPGCEKQMTGNLSSEGGTPIQSLYNCLFLNGFGCCAAFKGMHCVGNSFNHAQQSGFVEGGTPKKLPHSGANVLTGGGQIPSNIIGGWMEGGTVQVVSKGGFTTIMGVRFQGINGESAELGVEGGEEEIPEWVAGETYNVGDLTEAAPGVPKGSGVWESLQDENKGHAPVAGSEWWVEVIAAEYSIEGGARIINCYFRHYAKACIKEAGSQPIIWDNCQIGATGKEKIRKIPFIERTGKFLNVPLFAAFGFGRVSGREEENVGGKLEVVGAATYSSPPFPPEEKALEVVGISAQSFTAEEGYDVWLVVPVSYAAGGKLTEQRYAGVAGNEAWQIIYPTEEHAAGTKLNMRLYVKAGETVKLTTAGVAVGKGIVQWV